MELSKEQRASIKKAADKHILERNFTSACDIIAAHEAVIAGYVACLKDHIEVAS